MELKLELGLVLCVRVRAPPCAAMLSEVVLVS